MKTSWRIKKLNQVIDKVVYTKKIHRKQFLSFGKFPIISQEKDFINGYWDNEKDLFRLTKPVAIFGDHTQVLKYVDFDFVLGADGVKILQPKHSLDSKYLYYSLQSATLKNLGYARHFRLLKEINVRYPESINEQKRIAKNLDKIFFTMRRESEIAEKNLQNSKDLFRAHLNNLFDNPKANWKSKKLKDFYDITSSKRVFKSEWRKIGVPFYRAREIVKLAQHQSIKNALYISEGMYDEYAKKYGIPKENDLMVTGVGTLGICYLVKRDDKFYFKDGNIIWLRAKNNINSRFVEYAFKSSFFEKQIHDGKGATVGTYTIIRAKNTTIPTPAIVDQGAIVQQLDQLSANTEKLQKIYKQKIFLLAELKRTVLSRVFSGEL